MSAVPCPWDKASVWSKISFWWLNPLFRTGSKRRLEPEDMYDVPLDDEAAKVEGHLNEFWTKELQKCQDVKGPNLLYVVLMAFKKSWMLPGILLFLYESLKLVQPFLVGGLITYFSPSSKTSDTEAYLYGVGLGVTALIQVFCNPLYFFSMQRVGMRMRTAMAGLIYRKMLSLNSKSFAKTSSGKIVNLLSTDIEKLTIAAEHFNLIWIMPISSALSAYFIYTMVGLPCVFGLAVIPLLLPTQVVTARIFWKLRFKIGAWSDKRIHMMTEILSGIRVIKMYCWEKPFSKLINSLRNKEIRFLRISFIFRSISKVIEITAPRVMALLIFVGHWLAGYPPLPLENIFMTFGWLAVMRLSVFDFLYYGIECISELAASLSRIQTFLMIVEDSSSENALRKIQHNTYSHSDWMIEVKNVSTSWESVEQSVPPSSDESLALVERQGFSLKDINLTVKKSSLLSVLLEDLPCVQGHVVMCGSLSYSCQQPWVFSGTVRDNILFGDELDISRYESVLQACALSRDISRMPYGDETLVGERGHLLSGGQKARITLARAVYRKRDIYLLDDPLSAVDTKVGKHIFNRCICELLKGTTRILITHQIQHLKAADRILVMSNGGILQGGSYEEILSHNLELSSLMAESGKEKNDDLDILNRKHEDELSYEAKISTSDAEVQEEESRYSGSVGIGVYIQYFKAGKGVFFVPAVLFFLVVYQGLYTYSDWLLAHWTETVYSVQRQNAFLILLNGSHPPPTENLTVTHVHIPSASRNWYSMVFEMRLYIICCLAYFVFATLALILILQMTAVASQNLHNQLFQIVLGSKTRFFDGNPVGRILNRFSRDIGFLDTQIGQYMSFVLRLFFDFLSVLIVTLIISPWLLIPITPLILFIAYLRHYAVKTTRDVRRLEGNARSPVYSHVSDTINGLQTIRAMKKESQFYNHFVRYQNIHTSAWFIYISSYRWFSIRTVFTLALYTGIVNFVCIALGNTISQSLLALVLTYCSAVGEPFEFFVRMSAEFENVMTSTERILSYTNLEQENPGTSATPPPPTWPTHGNISFKDTCLRYSSGGPLVLKHLDFHIHAKEKVSLEGRELARVLS